VIISDLNFVRAVNSPDEADAVLIVDPDAMLSDPVALQRFQPVAWRDAQVVQVGGCFNLVQFAKSNRCDGYPAAAGTRFIEILRIGILEALDHLPP